VARRLLLVADTVLLLVAAVLAGRLHDAWVARPAPPPHEAGAPGAAEPPPPAEAAPARPPLSTYAVIAERNLFSPTRSEVAPEASRPVVAGGAPAAPPPPRPRLYGVVVLPDGRGRAFLEDVQRRRVFAYSVGDAVGDARLEEVRPDRVVLRRGGETFEVLLHDPTKPRPAAPPPGVQSPTAGGAGGSAAQPTTGGPTRSQAARPVGVPPGVIPPRVPFRPRSGITAPGAPIGVPPVVQPATPPAGADAPGAPQEDASEE
jgi:hypothetical protein